MRPFLLLTMAAAMSLPGATIFSQTADGAGVSSTTQYIGFSLAGTWNNVSIAVELGNPTSGSSARFFLTDQVGPGTTAADEWTPNVTLSTPSNGFNTVFSGMTLGPGNYFLTFQNLGGAVGLVGFGGTPAAQTLGSGVGLLGSAFLGSDAFAPAGAIGTTSRINNVLITGDPAGGSAVPEPGTYALTLGAGAAMWLLRRRRGN